MTKGTEPVQAWRTADGRLFKEQSDARDWDELLEFEKTRTDGWAGTHWRRQGVLSFLTWRREQEKAAESHADKPDDPEGGTARPVTCESVAACLRALSASPVVHETTSRPASTQRRFEVIL